MGLYWPYTPQAQTCIAGQAMKCNPLDKIATKRGRPRKRLRRVVDTERKIFKSFVKTGVKSKLMHSLEFVGESVLFMFYASIGIEDMRKKRTSNTNG